MKEKILVDIDVIIEYLKTGKGKLTSAYETFQMQITSTTYTELLASETFQDASLEKEVIDFIKKYFEVIEISERVGLEAARTIRESDVNFATALFIATARIHSLEILTNSPKAFEGVQGVSFVQVD